jgi:hypothetical protein
VRRKKRDNYPIRAYVLIGTEEIGFWCRVERRRFITTDVGQEMEATNKTLYTPTDIEFKQNQAIRLTREGEYNYSIDDVFDVIDETNDSAHRGNPVYITKLEIS